ncbi:MAG: RNA methyltransferase [Verrucomicrobiota bacterium]|nr:RNA methyltransferase [Verrucomicrobiota bacterium]
MVNLDNIRIVLAGPLCGGNVGAVCRAMGNMGLSDLALVAPRRLNMDEARWMACHAAEILDNRAEFGALPEAVADCAAVLGTTARPGLYRRHARTPREWAPRILEGTVNGRVALVFGREDNGLSNDELAVCNHVIRIPSTEEYPSLNVAQAVLVCAYEVYTASARYSPPREKSPDASSALKERMIAMWRQMLLDIGFMKPEKADHMMLGLRRIFGRGAQTTDDVRILMGVARQAEWVAAAVNGAAGRPAGAADCETTEG